MLKPLYHTAYCSCAQNELWASSAINTQIWLEFGILTVWILSYFIYYIGKYLVLYIMNRFHMIIILGAYITLLHKCIVTALPNVTTTEPLRWHFPHFFSCKLIHFYAILIRNYKILIRNYHILIHFYEILIRFYEILICNYEILIRFYEILFCNNEILFCNNEILFCNNEIIIRKYKITFRKNELNLF
jgi:hypothetical protein